MTLYSADSFNRTDSTSVVGATDGAGSLDALTWTTQQGTCGINGNQAYASGLAAAGGLTAGSATVDLGTADADVSLTLATRSTAACLMFRFVDTSNFWIIYEDTNNAYLYKNVAGTLTQVGSAHSGAGDGDVLRVVTSGSSITIYRGATQLDSISDSFNASATKFGYLVFSTSSRVDDFSASSAPATTPQQLTVTQTQTPTIARAVGKIVSLTQSQTPTMDPQVPGLLIAMQTQTPSIRRTVNKTLSVTHTQTPSMTRVASVAHQVVVPLLNAAPTVRNPSVGKVTSPTPGSSEAAPVWVIKVVNMGGSVLQTLTLAEVDTITWTLNQPDECEFHFPKNAYTASQLAVLGTGSGPQEVQVYRNGDIVFWGPVIGLDGAGGDGAVKCRASGVDWYLNRRFVDGTVTNHLSNADFESGLTSWTTVGCTATSDTVAFQTGSKSAKLVETTDGADHYISQTVTMGGNAVGLLCTVSAWFLIDSITAPAYQTRALYIAGTYAGTFQGDNYYVIDTATPQGTWVKASTTLWVPPSQVWDMEVRCYAPNGIVRWDDVKLVAMDSLACADHFGTTLIPIDINQALRRLIAHMQNTAVGKSDLNIGVDTATTGVKVTKVYQFVDHIQFDQALREYLERDDGCDYQIAITPTTRTFRTPAAKRGTDRSGTVTLRYSVSAPTTSNCANYHFVEDGSGCVTLQTMLGEDNGPDREQGESTDASSIGGTILQDVRQAPQDTAVGSLQPLADERLARFSVTPQTIDLDLILGLGSLFPTLREGDLVTVVIDDGFVSVSGVYRIMRRKLNCVTNVMTVTVTLDTL